MTFFGPDIRNGLPIGLGSVAGFGRRAFTPSVLFAAGEQGFWYDPSDYTTLYQDSAGTTPVAGVEQAVGLILDKSKGLVIGPELVDTANSSSSWTGYGTNTVEQDGDAVKITYVDNGGGAYVFMTAAGGTSTNLTTGKTYRVTAEVRCNTGSVSIGFNDGVSESTIAFTSTTYVGVTFNVTILAANPFMRLLNFATGEIGWVRNISVRELAGNHAIQTGATNRPILRSRYNGLTFSEDITNAAWTKSGITVTGDAGVAPDGTTTADRMTAGAIGYYLQSTGTLNGTNMPVTATIRIKNEDYTASDTLYFSVSDGLSGAMQITFKPFDGTFTTPAVAASWSSVTRTVTDIGGGYWLLTMSGTTTQWSGGWMTVGVTAAHGRSCLVWGHDLRRQCDTYLPYQRIGASTDYDTVGFPVYLAFDGSDDSLYTGGSIDFSATDKMTAWIGVTAFNNNAMMAELSTNTGSAGAGAFYFYRDSDLWYWTVYGTTLVATQVAAGALPSTRVLTGVADIAAPLETLRVDGAATSKTDSLGTGNFGNHVFYIGRRANASLPFNGRLYQLIGRGAATSAALITQAERWVAGKQGRAL